MASSPMQARGRRAGGCPLLLPLMLVVAACAGSAEAFVAPAPAGSPPRFYAVAMQLEGYEGAGGLGVKVQVEVKATARSPVDHVVCDVVQPKDGSLVGIPLVLTAFSGIASDGREVVGVCDIGEGAKKNIEVDRTQVVRKPAETSWAEAAWLPHHAIHTMGALEHAGVTAENVKGMKCVVTGGHGASLFAISALAGMGAKVTAASTANHAALRKAGATEVVDFRKESFSEVVTPDLIFDTIGREGTGSIDAMRQMRGTKYVSVMPAILKVAVDEGVIFGGSKLLAYKKALDGNGQARGWIPHMAAMGHIARTTRLIQQGEIVPRGLQSGFIGMQEYLETLSWPKDSDTGLRYGFVGRTSDYWLADEVEDEYEARGVPSPKSRMHHSEDYKPLGGGVIEVFSEAGILRETKQGPSVLFISTDTCVVCNYLHAFYRKLVPKYEQVRFLHMNAHSDPSVITEDMGIASVPAFVIYRSGKRIMSMQTNAKDEVERSIQELLSTPIS